MPTIRSVPLFCFCCGAALPEPLDARSMLLGAGMADLSQVCDADFQEWEGLRETTESSQREAEVPRSDALAAAIADLPRDGQLLLVELDGPLRLAQVGVDP